ncbi:MAG: outer membrane beta-barrel protein [Verrucomicrobiota bacterium]
MLRLRHLFPHAISAAFVSSALLISAHAEPANPTAKDLEVVLESFNYIETADPGIQLSGYVDVGYIYNFSGNTPNTQGYAADGGVKGDFSVNQVKLVLEKPLSGNRDELEAGFRVDLMTGEDAGGFGFGPGGAANSNSIYLQQAYVEMNIPYGNGLNLIIGQFNSMLGLEADERVDNINITQGFNAAPDPGPAAGVLATYAFTEQLSIAGGIINGAGASTNLGINTDEDGYALTGALALSNQTGNAETQLAFHWAPWGDAGVGAGQTQNEHLLGINWIGTWAPQTFDDKLFLGYNASLWLGENYAGNNSTALLTTSWYAKYQWTDRFSTAGRFEYTHNNDGQITGLTTTGGSDDVYGWTGTLGFQLFEELLIRTEYRIDWGNDVTSNPSDEFGHTLAMQAVYSF